MALADLRLRLLLPMIALFAAGFAVMAGNVTVVHADDADVDTNAPVAPVPPIADEPTEDGAGENDGDADGSVDGSDRSGPQTDYAAAVERAFINAAAEIAPSVVMIEVERAAEQQGAGGGGENPQYRRRPDNGRCTGVIISADGFVITSSYNLEGTVQSVEVYTADGEVYTAQVLGRNENTDLGLLKLDGVRRLPVPDFGDSRDLKIGRFVGVVGRGESVLNHSLTTGILSAVERQGNGAIQFDAQVNYANTGGALITLRGELIGIANTIRPGVRHGMNSGVCFGMPWDLVEKDLPALKRGEVITRPRGAFLGITPGETPLGVSGVRINQVQPDSAADQGGMLEGDIIIKLDDDGIGNLADLRAFLRDKQPGDRIKVVVQRDGEEKVLRITLGERE